MRDEEIYTGEMSEAMSAWRGRIVRTQKGRIYLGLETRLFYILATSALLTKHTVYKVFVLV